jgi:Fe-S-cluster-containing dehydrogenase component
MQKLNCIICDKCRIVCTDNHIIIKGKKRELHYCKQCYRAVEDDKLIDTFVERLKRIGIDVAISANYPWIYLDSINGKKVTEVFESEHSFTVAWFPVNINNKACFSDITEIFKLIRKYI